MANFTAFAADMLQIVANFLWQDSTKWITCCCVLLGIVALIRRLFKLAA